MKNPTSAQLSALHERAQDIASSLPQLTRSADGRLSSDAFGVFSAAAQKILRRERAVGASLVLLSPSGATDVFCFGHARMKAKIPVTPHTCFRLASVSKLVMTFGALSLAADGLLPLDEDLGDLPGFPLRNPHAPDIPITMRMLLTHTSGIRDEGTYGTRGMQPGCTLKELLSDPDNWLPHAPGSVFHYSNLGAGAAGVVMECAANQPFETIMQTRVFAPLSIRASYDPARIAPADDLADGYAVRGILPPLRRYDAATLTQKPPQGFDPPTDYLIAAGRMITDSDGMGELLRLFASNSDTPVLSAKDLALMRAPQDGTHGVTQMQRGLNTGYLPGVFPGISAIGHQGIAYGMCAEFFVDPCRGCGVGLMTSGVRLTPQPPLMRAGFDLLALGFAALND